MLPAHTPNDTSMQTFETAVAFIMFSFRLCRGTAGLQAPEGATETR